MHSLEVYSRKIIIRARSNIVHDILCDVVMKVWVRSLPTSVMCITLVVPRNLGSRYSGIYGSLKMAYFVRVMEMDAELY